MPGTYSQILFHFAFSTKKRTPTIIPDLQPRLYDYIGGIVRGERGVLYEIVGMPDHVHLLIRWRTDETVATLMRNLKSHSSRWVHQTFPERNGFYWQLNLGLSGWPRTPCAPLGLDELGNPFPGVALRSTPGYAPWPLRGRSANPHTGRNRPSEDKAK